jgi:prepilin-type N-terminal cleavage/methylation domain-containing protein
MSSLGSLIRRLSLRQRFLAHKGSRGFTQIEMAITVVVIGVLAAIAAPSFQKWQQQKKVDQAVIILDNVIRETQGEAVKRSQNCDLVVREDFNPQSSGAIALVSGNCIISTRELEFVGIRLWHTPGSGTPDSPCPSPTSNPSLWTITFNARGENRQPPNGPGTAIFCIPNTDIQPKCIVMSVGIGLRRSGRWSRRQCITT